MPESTDDAVPRAESFEDGRDLLVERQPIACDDERWVRPDHRRINREHPWRACEAHASREELCSRVLGGLRAWSAKRRKELHFEALVRELLGTIEDRLNCRHMRLDLWATAGQRETRRLEQGDGQDTVGRRNSGCQRGEGTVGMRDQMTALAKRPDNALSVFGEVGPLWLLARCEACAKDESQLEGTIERLLARPSVGTLPAGSMNEHNDRSHRAKDGLRPRSVNR